MWPRVGAVAAIVAAAAAATFCITGVEYQNALPRDAADEHRIVAFQMVARGPLGPHMLLECSSRCVAEPSCYSFVVNPGSRRCYLSRLNRCVDRDSLLLSSPGYFYYEKFEVDSSPMQTCFASCLLKNNTCRQCGRPNCWGDRCQHCATTCWERMDKSNDRTTLFRDLQEDFHYVTCNGDWQLWWTTGWSSPDRTPNEALLLRLTITYVDGRTLNADFGSVQVRGKGILSVGSLIQDDGAGNWWEAPFTDRPLRSFPYGNCYSFYTPNTTCVSLTAQPAEEQLLLYNDTILYRGYPWLIGNESYDNVSISMIDLWVKCAHCD